MSSSEYPPPPNPQYQQPYPQQYAAPASSSRRVVRRVDVLSAAKVFAIMSALFWAVWGLILIFFGALCGGLFAAVLPTNDSGAAGGLGAGLIGSLFGWLIGIVFVAIVGFITGALYAWVYNMASQWIGGLQVEVE